MTKTLIAACALLLVFGQSSEVRADELTLGSKAPKLEVEKFIKGDEVKKFEKGKTYVVELWATWCGPCLATIPHLTELQKKYEDVVFIGVAVLEEDRKAVPDFVEEMGAKMEYRVAIDQVPEDSEPAEGKVVKNWMEPAGLQGIPSAFIINGEGVIAWIGHPAQMEEPLSQIVEGRWDLVAEAKKITEAKELQKKMVAIFTNLQKLYAEFNNDNEPDELLKALSSAEKEIPEQAVQFQLIRFQVLSLTKDRTADAIETVNALLESDKADDWQLLNNIAWIIVNPDRDSKADPKLIKLALKVALKADELTDKENPSIADTLAKVYFDNGDLAKAVKTQERVIELAEGSQMAADPSVKKRLKQYKKALEASTAKSKAE
ncbi:TlpA family protein disulfide reductase [Schlesneria paludicola]|uniref:TlpA family protein disulfide reductase n=1 Tax=Schlesneria paludicola TaxID=360056 RepID=UPI00029A9601|nr:TlpA disulfide reductase family protein [Schlesneria paludicola]